MKNEKSMIKFELAETNVLTRWPCHICGGTTDKWEILCETKEGPFDGYTRICENCLKTRNFDEKLKKQIQGLRTYADELETMVGRIKAPTYEEWWEAEKKRHHPDDLIDCTDNGESCTAANSGDPW